MFLENANVQKTCKKCFLKMCKKCVFCFKYGVVTCTSKWDSKPWRINNLLRNLLKGFRQIGKRYCGNFGFCFLQFFLFGSSGSSSFPFPQTSSEQGNLILSAFKIQGKIEELELPQNIELTSKSCTSECCSVLFSAFWIKPLQHICFVFSRAFLQSKSFS